MFFEKQDVCRRADSDYVCCKKGNFCYAKAVVTRMKDLSSEKVLILYTGGTIGMKQTENGYAPVPGYLPERLHSISDLSRPDMPLWELCEFSPLMDSSDISAADWNCMAEQIALNYEKYSGFVILHGTDTMAYTASALSFMLEGLSKPVILTGSQIPLAEVRSDALDNLVTSVIIAAEGVVKEVCLYFGGKLLRGNRATKMSADRLVAFDSPNYPTLAQAGIDIGYHRDVLRGVTDSSVLHLHRFSDVPIGVLKVFPGIQFGLFRSIITEKLSGVVLETFGAGNIPRGGNELLPIIESAFRAGAVVTVCSQCPAGAVSLGAYESSTALKKAGAVSGKDMTTEAAVTKLYALFSRNYPIDTIKELMEKNLAGELTE